MWILFSIGVLIAVIIILWCCRDILLRPCFTCLETTFYWLWRIISWPFFRLWDGLQIVAYPLKEAALSCSDSCYRYCHPATEL